MIAGTNSTVCYFCMLIILSFNVLRRLYRLDIRSYGPFWSAKRYVSFVFSQLRLILYQFVYLTLLTLYASHWVHMRLFIIRHRLSIAVLPQFVWLHRSIVGLALTCFLPGFTIRKQKYVHCYPLATDRRSMLKWLCRRSNCLQPYFAQVLLVIGLTQSSAQLIFALQPFSR